MLPEPILPLDQNAPLVAPRCSAVSVRIGVAGRLGDSYAGAGCIAVIVAAGGECGVWEPGDPTTARAGAGRVDGANFGVGRRVVGAADSLRLWETGMGRGGSRSCAAAGV